MKKEYLQIILLIAVFMLNSTTAYSEHLGYRHGERVSDEKNLVDESQVWSICHSSSRVFFATNDGLFVYDGARLIRHYDSRVIVLHDIKYDEKTGRIYSAGNNGFGWWEEDMPGHYIYHSVVSDNYSVHNQDFWRIGLTAEGKVYFQNFSRICVFDPADGEIIEILPASHFRFMHEVNGQIFVQDGQDLCLINPAGSLLPIGKTEDRIMNIVSCGNKLILALERTGLMELRGGKLTALDSSTNKVLSRLKIFSLASFDNSHVMVGTTQGGCFIVGSDGTLQMDSYRSPEFSNATILSMSRDFNGDIWLGMEAGIARIDGSSQDYYLQDSRLGRVHGVVPVGEGRLLIGTNKGAFLIKDNAILPIEGISGSVWNVYVFEGIPYIAHDLGLYTLDGNFRAHPVFMDSGVWSMVQCNRDRSTIVCGTYNGLALFRIANGKVSFVSMIKNYGELCRNIDIDDTDRIWIRDWRMGFICLTIDYDRKEVTDRRNHELVKKESDFIFSATLDNRLLFFRNREGYSINPVTSELERDTRADEDLSAFERSYGDPSGRGKSTKPFPVGENTYAFGLLNGIRTCYGPRIINESLTVPVIELLGTRQSRSMYVTGNRIRVPYNMNTVKIYAAGNFNNNAAEVSTDNAPGVWSPVNLNQPIQVSSLPFGNHTISLRLKDSPDISCSLALRVLRPWYLTGYAIAGYMVIILLIAYGIRAYYKREEKETRERTQLKSDLKSKTKELANITFNNAQRNVWLNEIKDSLSDPDKASKDTARLIDSFLEDESDWEKSEEYFNVIYDGLLDKLKNTYPGISKTDMKLCVYTKLNLSTKEIANLMNISVRSVEMARYRLRKRLNLPAGQSINYLLKDL